MSYFRLVDDVYIPGRWHLGEVKRGSRAALGLINGIRVDEAECLSVEATHPGRPLEFSLTSFAVPIVTDKLGEAISRVAGSELQLLPISIDRAHAHLVLNPTRLIDCLDETRSKFTKWTPNDLRSDLAGQYREVTKLYIAPREIPSDAHIFRIMNWPVALIVSDLLKKTMLSSGSFGAKFMDVG
jgi:hypothetical protein